MAYEPNPAPDFADLETLKRYLQEELRRINADVIDNGQETFKFDVAYAEPAKPRDGMVVYADGTEWNPSHGQGFYYWNNTLSSWVFMGSSDLMLDIPAGDKPNHTSVNKFGRGTNFDNGDVTDIWDGANATDDLSSWVAPTAARTHKLWSDDNADKTASSGAHLVQLYGLESWSATAESSEQITLAGSSTVATQNQYVIVHRMKVIGETSATLNQGVIRAEASGDDTVTAQINALEGQTQMAVYGISSRMNIYMTAYYASLNKAVKTAGLDVRLVACATPDIDPTVFTIKHTKGLISTGTSDVTHNFRPYNKFAGPVILKLQAISDTNDTAVDGGFEGIIESGVEN